MPLVSLLQAEFNIAESYINHTIQLFDQGMTIPFIARYRKDHTNGLDEVQLFNFQKALNTYRKFLAAQKKARERLVELKRDALLSELTACQTLADIKELMAPYKSKRKTKASIAREEGLQPDADIILGRAKGKIREAKLEKILHIVAEEVVGHPEAKRIAEQELRRAVVEVVVHDDTYQELADTNTVAEKLRPHQIHALLRAEKEKAVSLKFAVDSEQVTAKILRQKIHKSPYPKFYKAGLQDGVKRLLLKRAETSVRSQLKEKADHRAVEVFKQNLRDLLLTPPIAPTTILAIDPGYRTGCKVAVVDESGKLQSTATIYPTPPKSATQAAAKKVMQLVQQYNVGLVVIGNGTASQETAKFVQDLDVEFVVVAETGASVYSASKIAREEFPDMPVEIRGAVSIARRVLDPLAEYIKIDPKALGIGQYQHDIDPKMLDEVVQFTVESAVNKYGIDLDTASKELLQFVAGLNESIAKNIVEHRNANGFPSRRELLKVKRLGKATYEQCAGFLKLSNGHPFDDTMIHPSNYKITESILAAIHHTPNSWVNISEQQRAKLLKKLRKDNYTTADLGTAGVKDIFEELLQMGNDPRGTRKFTQLIGQVQSIEELEVGSVLKGKVNNVTDFGAFVDLGIKSNGLIHKSKLADHFIKDVHSVVSVNDIVKVEVLDVDLHRKRISLRLVEKSTF